MERIYIKNIQIEKVRHLMDEKICISDDMHHLIITGKNGSGKTSLLECISGYLDSATTKDVLRDYPNLINIHQKNYDNAVAKSSNDDEIAKAKKRLDDTKNTWQKEKHGINIEFNVSVAAIKRVFEQGQFVLAYYKDERVLRTEIPKHVEKTELKDFYRITEQPRNVFVKYLLDLKMTEALSAKAGKNDKAEMITRWFVQFEQILKDVYMDSSVKLLFDEETFEFHIVQDGKEPFGFNELSRGFAAVLDIIIDLMIRMEKHTNRAFRFDIPGIVLIDEIETHLHLELQKKIMVCLTKLFPNIQFIVSTHSPFVLNSLDDVVIYDLENKVTVREGLQNIPYDGIVESYFNVDRLSEELRSKFDEYKKLTQKNDLTDSELSYIAELEMYLSEIPDYLALDIATEFERIKAEFDRREDI